MLYRGLTDSELSFKVEKEPIGSFFTITMEKAPVIGAFFNLF